ncbi:hypothetical protein NQ318_022320 [Aromia moschata]|uniref:Uncharacterized protein n=1 Tax=Aromia moschata TaxID=1265417 RepID=A0AAV8Z771_9CUCU|nr:hypothetical protein NQ318_022320 [Aromia moschata]
MIDYQSNRYYNFMLSLCCVCSGMGEGIRVSKDLLGRGNLVTSDIELSFHRGLSGSGDDTLRL